MIQPLLTILCTDKGLMVQAQYCPEWTEIWYIWHTCLIPLFRDDRPTVVRVYYPLQVFIIDWLLMFVNQTQVGADLRYLLLEHVTYIHLGLRCRIGLRLHWFYNL